MSKFFFQFLIFFCFFFISISYYFSYTIGIKSYVTSHYSQSSFLEDVAIANRASPFFSHSLSDYTLDKLKYPHPLDSLYCETTVNDIDLSKPHYIFKKNYYQFYSVISIEIPLNDRRSGRLENEIHSSYTDSSRIAFLKDTVVDVAAFIRSEKPLYSNYSGTFYSLKYSIDTLNMEKNNGVFKVLGASPYYSVEAWKSNKDISELMDQKNPELIKERLQKLLDLVQKYEIPTNLTTDQWLQLVYQPNAFEVTNIIRRVPNLDLPSDYYDDDYYYDYNYVVSYPESAQDISEEFTSYKTEILTDYYLSTRKLYNTFENIEHISHTNIFEGTIHFFIWIAFFLASILFAFRVTGLRPLLFGIILSGILTMMVGLGTILFDFAGGDSSLVALNSIFFMGTIILILPLFFLKIIRKSFLGIFVVLSIVGFAGYLLTIIGIISTLQRQRCVRLFDYNYEEEKCFILMNYLGENTSYILLLASLIFLLLYTSIIKKWRALPER